MTSLSTYLMAIIVPYVLRHYIWSFPRGFDWCYECSAWPTRLGPELSLVIVVICSVTLGSGIVFLAVARQHALNHEGLLVILRKKFRIILVFTGVAIGSTVGVYFFLGFSVIGEITAVVFDESYILQDARWHPEILEGAAVVDEATLNQVPKFKEVMDEAYKRKDARGPSSEYTSQISAFELDSITAIFGKDQFADHIPDYGRLEFTVEYKELYYNILIRR